MRNILSASLSVNVVFVVVVAGSSDGHDQAGFNQDRDPGRLGVPGEGEAGDYEDSPSGGVTRPE